MERREMAIWCGALSGHVLTVLPQFIRTAIDLVIPSYGKPTLLDFYCFEQSWIFQWCEPVAQGPRPAAMAKRTEN